MPDIPVTSPLGYVGVFLAVVGFFLILAGFNVIKIENITATPGCKTWTIGVLLVIGGIALLLLEIIAPLKTTTFLQGLFEPTLANTATQVVVAKIPDTLTVVRILPTDTSVSPIDTDTLTPESSTSVPISEPPDIAVPMPTDTPTPMLTDTPTPIPAIAPNAYWQFEEGQGSTVLDSSGNGNIGSISGARYTTGVFGGFGLLFLEEGDFVSIPAGQGTELLHYFPNGITAEAFINPKPGWLPIPPDRQKQRIMYIFWADDDVYSLSLKSDEIGNTFLNGGVICENPSGIADISVSAAFSNDRTGKFSHVALTFGSGVLRLYMDGVEVDSKSDNGECGSTVGPVGNRNVAHIGSDETAICCDHDRDFRGVIDEVRITGRPLDPTQFLGP